MFTTRPPTTSPLLSFSETLFNQNLIHNLSFPISHSKPNKNLSYLKSSPLKAMLAMKSESQSPVSQTPAQTRVDILAESLPFIQKFRGKTIVVKYGGAAMKSETLQASVINDLVLLSCVGLCLVFVLGGGPEINSWLSRLGIKPNFLNGLRVTDLSTMEIVEMVLVGKVNKQLVSLINKAGATVVGLSGKDGRLLTVRPNIKSAELGFVGDVLGWILPSCGP